MTKNLSAIALGATWLAVVASCAKIKSEANAVPDGGNADVSGGSGGAPAPGINGGSGGSTGSTGTGGVGGSSACKNLQCQQVPCPNGGTTTISGTAFAPNGTLPLYNVQVYVPNAPLQPFTDGASCDRCGGATVRAVASTVSNEHGRFVLTNAPVGKNIPLVFQVGKWRRQVVLDNVAACQDNPVADPNQSRLPRNRKEGDMPRIAVTTGGCDQLGCLLPKVGVDASELGIAGDNRAVTYFKGVVGLAPPGGPAGMTPASAFWRSEAELSKYDITLLSCECAEELDGKGPQAYDAMTKYLAKGGRIFGTDFMYVWYQHSTDPNLSGAMSILTKGLSGGADIGRSPMRIDTSFPKGKALADWMMVVDPSVTYGEIEADAVYDNINGVMTPTAQTWASSATMGEPVTAADPRILTINTPAGAAADQQCGRAVHLDTHILQPMRVNEFDTTPFPDSCGTTLNKGEQALAFFFFDLASCIQDDSKPIIPPIVIP